MTSEPSKKHRRSVRLKKFNYSTAGAYFVTICTENRKSIFGNVLNGGVMLNDYGEIARDEWIRTGDVRDNVEIDEFIIMPNHVHGIIVIKPDDMGKTGRRGMALTCPSSELPPISKKGTPTSCPYVKREFGKPETGSLGIIIANYKSIVTKRIWKIAGSKIPVWQRNYYEHVIRSETDLNAIRQYIIDNPANWEDDEYYV